MTVPRSTTAGRTRRIGPLGTALRIAVALGLLYLARGAGGLSWHVEWYGLAGGLVALSALTLLVGLAARRYAADPVRFTGPAGHAMNCAAIVALLVNPYSGDAVSLFCAATLLVAVWRGQPGCEITVLPNWVLRRDDQVGCPVFAPFDALEARRRMRRGVRPVGGPRLMAAATDRPRQGHTEAAGMRVGQHGATGSSRRLRPPHRPARA